MIINLKDIFKRKKEESKNVNSIWKLMIYTYRFAEGKRHLLFLYVAMFLLSNIVSLSETILSGKIFNFIQINNLNSTNINHLILLVTGLLAITIIFWLLHGPARIIEQKISFYISNNFRNYLYTNTLDLPLSFHNEEHSGQIISKINKGNSSLDKFVSNSFILLRSFCTALAVFMTLFIYDYRFGLLGLIMLIVVYFVNTKFEKVINPYRDGMNKTDNVTSEIVYDTISNITTIKMLSLSKLVHIKLSQEIEKKYKLLKGKIFYNEIKWFMPAFFGGLLIQSVLLFYIYNLYITGAVLLVGEIYILYGFLRKLEQVMEDISWMTSFLQDESRDIVNSEALSNNFSKIKNDKVKQITSIQSIELSNLHFKYSEVFDLQIDNLKLEKGKSYAFVGESGCGKTTAMKILASLVECEGYQMRIQGPLPTSPSRGGGNADASGLAPSLVGRAGERPELSGMGVALENIRDSVMLIPQEPELFSNSIRENITLGLPYTEKEVNEVLDMVNMRETVEGLPEGIESKVYEKGVNLSGGQKQRLALARGILFARDKEIILLDEPTSSVDQDNEERIYKSLLILSKDKILISSVHKRNLLTMFDHIVYFENGRITKVEKVHKNTSNNK